MGGAGTGLRVIPARLLGHLRFLLLQDVAARRQQALPRCALGDLELHRLGDQRPVIAGRRRERGRPLDRATPDIRLEARLLRLKVDDAVRQRAFGRRHLGARQADQDLARLDVLPLTDVELLDVAAVAMLHGLAVAGDRDLALAIGGGVEPRETRPADQDDEEQDRDETADPERVAR